MEYLLFLFLFFVIITFGVINYRYNRKKGEELTEIVKRFMR